MDKQAIKLYKRLSIKFKVIRIITAILGLFIFFYGLSVMNQLVIGLFGAVMVLLGAYFFLDRLPLIDGKDDE